MTADRKPKYGDYRDALGAVRSEPGDPPAEWVIRAMRGEETEDVLDAWRAGYRAGRLAAVQEDPEDITKRALDMIRDADPGELARMYPRSAPVQEDPQPPAATVTVTVTDGFPRVSMVVPYPQSFTIDDPADPEPNAEWNAWVAAPIVHRAPTFGRKYTPCCHNDPALLPPAHRCTSKPFDVTCKGEPAPSWVPEGYDGPLLGAAGVVPTQPDSASIEGWGAPVTSTNAPTGSSAASGVVPTPKAGDGFGWTGERDDATYRVPTPKAPADE